MGMKLPEIPKFWIWWR